MKSIAITSGKGGTGKSCIAAYTGAALAMQGRKTLLLELGCGYRSLDIIAGVQDQVVYDIADVLSGCCDLEKAIVQTRYHEKLFLLPAGLSPAAGVDNTWLGGVLRTLSTEFDMVILDGVDFAAFSPKLVDIVLQVLTPDTLCIRACAQQSRALCELGAKQLRLVINQVPAEILPMQGARDFDDIIDQVGAQLIAVIPESPKLRYASNNARRLDPESITVRVFGNLAGRLQGKRLPLLIR